MAELDHLIIKVNDMEDSTRFYRDLMGFECVKVDPPFTFIRVSETCLIQLASWGTPGLEHYAFAVSRSEFDAIFARILEQGIDYGSTFDSVGSNVGPGVAPGARGDAPTLYFADPNQNLVEIRTYDPD